MPTTTNIITIDPDGDMVLQVFLQRDDNDDDDDETILSFRVLEDALEYGSHQDAVPIVQQLKANKTFLTCKGSTAIAWEVILRCIHWWYYTIEGHTDDPSRTPERVRLSTQVRQIGKELHESRLQTTLISKRISMCWGRPMPQDIQHKIATDRNIVKLGEKLNTRLDKMRSEYMQTASERAQWARFFPHDALFRVSVDNVWAVMALVDACLKGYKRRMVQPNKTAMSSTEIQQLVASQAGIRYAEVLCFDLHIVKPWFERWLHLALMPWKVGLTPPRIGMEQILVPVIAFKYDDGFDDVCTFLLFERPMVTPPLQEYIPPAYRNTLRFCLTSYVIDSFQKEKESLREWITQQVWFPIIDYLPSNHPLQSGLEHKWRDPGCGCREAAVFNYTKALYEADLLYHNSSHQKDFVPPLLCDLIGTQLNPNMTARKLISVLQNGIQYQQPVNACVVWAEDNVNRLIAESARRISDEEGHVIVPRTPLMFDVDV